MTHVDEQTLILYYYREVSEPETVERHLRECGACREELAAIERDLDDVGSIPAPERGEDYGRDVWRAIAPRLERRRYRWMGYVAAAAVLLAGTFVAGRLSTRVEPTVAPAEVRERVLVVALGEHLDRSEVLLLEVVNADDSERGRETARELVRESRLYRQTAYRVGDVATGDALDELERLLLDVAHGTASSEEMTLRIEEQDVLFKIRALKASMKAREERLALQKF